MSARSGKLPEISTTASQFLLDRLPGQRCDALNTRHRRGHKPTHGRFRQALPSSGRLYLRTSAGSTCCSVIGARGQRTDSQRLSDLWVSTLYVAGSSGVFRAQLLHATCSRMRVSFGIAERIKAPAVVHPRIAARLEEGPIRFCAIVQSLGRQPKNAAMCCHPSYTAAPCDAEPTIIRSLPRLLRRNRRPIIVQLLFGHDQSAKQPISRRDPRVASARLLKNESECLGAA